MTRILIVEDSPAMRQLLAFALRGIASLELEQAGDGVAALKALTRTTFDLVILDLNMPVMDGMTLLERMGAAGHLAHTQVAVITTEESAATEAEARRRGARFFLRKPVNRKMVEALLAQALPAAV